MTQLVKTEDWANHLFGQAKLGDKRLTKRLVNIATQIGSHIGRSIVSTCEGDEAKLEGAYRFIRNARVDADAIAESGFQSTAELSQRHGTLLALEDTTTLGYSHQVSKTLGDLGGHAESKKKGFWVHNVLTLDAESEQTIGLIEQSYWTRDPNGRGIAQDRKKRPYEEKESFKWEAASRRIAQRLGDKMQDVISVCDREADIYEYLSYKQQGSQRFVIRASWNRSIESEQKSLFQEAASAPVLGHYSISIPQKGGRRARTATLALRSSQVSIKPPQRLSKQYDPIKVNLVVAEEMGGSQKELLRWLLLTSEAIDSFKLSRQITRYYELRWRVEDFHKAWKSSGTAVEELRLQQADNIRRIAVIMAFVAVRLLQLREIFHKARTCPSANVPCDQLLEKYEWQALWVTDTKSPLPQETPSAVWAYEAIARLGGWTDSKRTGVVGWATLWQGWYRLQDRVDGMMIALSLNEAVS
jgi:hypothetical protein